MFQSLKYPPLIQAHWPLESPGATEDVDALRAAGDAAAAASPWGWGYTIDFGSFAAEGFLGNDYLKMVGAIDRLEWWPESFEGQNLADVGRFTGGVSAILAARGARSILAIDEIPEHIEQCRVVKDALSLDNIETRVASVY